MRRVEHLLRATAKAEARHFWFRGFRAFVTPLLQQAAAGRVRPLLLDCGCGTGANLELLERFGRAYGFDLSEVGLRIGRAEGRMRLARATVTAVPFATASFDIVTSFDVLYALDDRHEQQAITEMFRLLKPEGFAIVNVAALNVLRGDHSVLSHEVRRYTREDLRRRLEVAGFSVVRALVGHGVGRHYHEDPQIPNFGQPGRGPLLAEGMTLAIEPMITAGSPEIVLHSDEWSISTEDSSLAAHFEHTVAVTDGDPRILTAVGAGLLR